MIWDSNSVIPVEVRQMKNHKYVIGNSVNQSRASNVMLGRYIPTIETINPPLPRGAVLLSDEIIERPMMHFYNEGMASMTNDADGSHSNTTGSFVPNNFSMDGVITDISTTTKKRKKRKRNLRKEYNISPALRNEMVRKNHHAPDDSFQFEHSVLTQMGFPAHAFQNDCHSTNLLSDASLTRMDGTFHDGDMLDTYNSNSLGASSWTGHKFDGSFSGPHPALINQLDNSQLGEAQPFGNSAFDHSSDPAASSSKWTHSTNRRRNGKTTESRRRYSSGYRKGSVKQKPRYSRHSQDTEFTFNQLSNGVADHYWTGPRHSMRNKHSIDNKRKQRSKSNSLANVVGDDDQLIGRRKRSTSDNILMREREDILPVQLKDHGLQDKTKPLSKRKAIKITDNLLCVPGIERVIEKRFYIKRDNVRQEENTESSFNDDDTLVPASNSSNSHGFGGVKSLLNEVRRIKSDIQVLNKKHDELLDETRSLKPSRYNEKSTGDAMVQTDLDTDNSHQNIPGNSEYLKYPSLPMKHFSSSDSSDETIKRFEHLNVQTNNNNQVNIENGNNGSYKLHDENNDDSGMESTFQRPQNHLTAINNTTNDKYEIDASSQSSALYTSASELRLACQAQQQKQQTQNQLIHHVEATTQPIGQIIPETNVDENEENKQYENITNQHLYETNYQRDLNDHNNTAVNDHIFKVEPSNVPLNEHHQRRPMAGPELPPAPMYRPELKSQSTLVQPPLIGHLAPPAPGITEGYNPAQSVPYNGVRTRVLNYGNALPHQRVAPPSIAPIRNNATTTMMVQHSPNTAPSQFHRNIKVLPAQTVDYSSTTWPSGFYDEEQMQYASLGNGESSSEYRSNLSTNFNRPHVPMHPTINQQQAINSVIKLSANQPRSTAYHEVSLNSASVDNNYHMTRQSNDQTRQMPLYNASIGSGFPSTAKSDYSKLFKEAYGVGGTDHYESAMKSFPTATMSYASVDEDDQSATLTGPFNTISTSQPPHHSSAMHNKDEHFEQIASMMSQTEHEESANIFSMFEPSLSYHDDTFQIVDERNDLAAPPQMDIDRIIEDSMRIDHRNSAAIPTNESFYNGNQLIQSKASQISETKWPVNSDGRKSANGDMFSALTFEDLVKQYNQSVRKSTNSEFVSSRPNNLVMTDTPSGRKCHSMGNVREQDYFNNVNQCLSPNMMAHSSYENFMC